MTTVDYPNKYDGHIHKWRAYNSKNLVCLICGSVITNGENRPVRQFAELSKFSKIEVDN